MEGVPRDLVTVGWRPGGPSQSAARPALRCGGPRAEGWGRGAGTRVATPRACPESRIVSIGPVLATSGAESGPRGTAPPCPGLRPRPIPTADDKVVGRGHPVHPPHLSPRPPDPVRNGWVSPPPQERSPRFPQEFPSPTSSEGQFLGMVPEDARGVSLGSQLWPRPHLQVPGTREGPGQGRRGACTHRALP